MSLKCLFGHKWDGCICSRCGKISHSLDGCRCTVCKKEIHDFRHENGCSPEATFAEGEYICSRCGAIFHRKYIRTECSYCGSKGWYDLYSSQSGCGGSWEEKCPYCGDDPSETKEWITYPKENN